MDYIEIAVTIEPYNEIVAEILIAELGDAGCDSFSETDSGFNAYIPHNLYNEETIRETLQMSNFTEKIGSTTTLVKAENWNALWESNFDPVIIGERCSVRAPFHTDLPKTELEIIIEPKMAFGTGHHETTYLMTEAVLDNDMTDLEVLDMGCGTAILAIAAALRGAKHVDAIDNDEWATVNAVENIEVNGVEDKVTVMTGDASLLGLPRYNLILANINRNILLNDMQYYVKSLYDGGTLIMSGIYVEDIAVIEKEAISLGLKKTGEKARNKWARVDFIK